MTVKAVLFDLWGTLIFNEKHREARNSVIELIGKENEKKFHKLLLNWWFTNNVDEKTFFEKICNDLNIDKSLIPRLEEIWTSQYEHATPFRDTYDVLENLQKMGLKTALVTNTAPYAKQIISNLKLDELFDEMIFSFEVGIAKPEEKIYKIAAERLQLLPQECLFIGDDVQNDVGGPRKIGMKSFLINRKYHGKDNIQNLKGVLDLIDWE